MFKYRYFSRSDYERNWDIHIEANKNQPKEGVSIGIEDDNFNFVSIVIPFEVMEAIVQAWQDSK